MSSVSLFYPSSTASCSIEPYTASIVCRKRSICRPGPTPVGLLQLNCLITLLSNGRMTIECGSNRYRYLVEPKVAVLIPCFATNKGVQSSLLEQPSSQGQLGRRNGMARWRWRWTEMGRKTSELAEPVGQHLAIWMSLRRWKAKRTILPMPAMYLSIFGSTCIRACFSVCAIQVHSVFSSVAERSWPKT